ncbi:MAG TPA: sensor histidine kinase [Xanthobacteraceae bacterium]|nr:sensor histidine kinase [Xanthobacteraceae bacterium]
MIFSRTQSARARGTRTIRGTLAWMVVGCVLPAWVGIAFLIVSMYASERDRALQNMIITSRALMFAVDRELATVTSAMEVLATSPRLERGDLAGFYQRAKELNRHLPGANIVLTDEAGQQVLNTLRPLGEPLPPRTDPANVHLVFSTGEPVVTDLFVGPVTKEPLVVIAVPVFRNGKVVYSLGISLLPARLGEILSKERLPAGRIAAIFDKSGTIVARNRNAEQFVGRKGNQRLIEAIGRSASGVVASTSLDGISVYSSFVRSEVSNWALAIGIPSAEMNRRLYTSLGLSAAGALFLLAIGLVLAQFKAKEITSDIEALVAPAMALGRNQVRPIPRLHIHEINDVAKALGRAFRVIERRTHERDHAEMEKQVAEKAARLKDEFVGTVSHELRTPLTSISASLGLLTNTATLDPNPAAKRLVAIAHNNCQRLVRLVNDILDVAKLEAGHVAFEIQRVDVQLLLEDAVDTNRALGAEAGVGITLNCDHGCAVEADPDRLTQVFSNLLSNAIKFSPSGSEVVVSLDRAGEAVRVSFRDHGPGIPPSFRPRLFEKFAQSQDGPKRGGTGLGLSIAREIVCRLGGEIGLEDAPGGGALFFVVLPSAEVAGADAHDALRSLARA